MTRLLSRLGLQHKGPFVFAEPRCGFEFPKHFEYVVCSHGLADVCDQVRLQSGGHPLKDQSHAVPVASDTSLPTRFDQCVHVGLGTRFVDRRPAERDKFLRETLSPWPSLRIVILAGFERLGHSRAANVQRDVLIFNHVGSALRKRSIICHNSAPRRDSKPADGRFMLEVLAGAAEMERNLTRERTRSAMAVKRSNGHRIGSVPYGHDLADDGTTLVPNESQQGIIQDIREMRSRGRKLEQIARSLTERGIPTKTKRSDKWSHQAVARILAR